MFRFALALSIAALAVLTSCLAFPPPGGGEGAVPTWNATTFPWPMFGQNIRRTSQSQFNGPTSANPASSKNWSYTAVGGAAINMQPVIDANGAYFGTWGVLRKDVTKTPDQWDKSDGRVYGLKLAAQGSPAAQQLFAPLLPAATPVGYLFPGRAKLGRDQFWCGANNAYLVSFYNGTVEGTPCLDPDDGTIYVGRGDGRLYAINPQTGVVKWSFATFNPTLPADPDGGGEIIGGPVMGRNKILYFATAAAPWPGSQPDNPCYETNAVYAVDTAGKLVWRYPSAQASLSNWILTPPALSNDARTLYVGTFGIDLTTPGALLAFDLTQPANATDANRVKWGLDLRNPDRIGRPFVYARALAVGADDRIYCAGLEPHFLGSSPAVFAVLDRDNQGEFVWISPFTEPQGYPSSSGQFAAGIALKEGSASVQTLFVTTSHVRGLINGLGGALFAIRPSDGAVLHAFDPATLPNPGVGGMTAPTIDVAGRVYAGIRGKHPAGNDPAVNGHMYGLFYNTIGFSLIWDYEVDGLLDWAAPAIGPNGGLYFGSTDRFTPGQEIEWFGPNDVPPNRSPKFYAVFE